MIDLKKEREAQGMTQQELADKCGVIRQTISNIECGFTKQPSIKLARKLGQVLGISWTYFFTE